MSAVYEFAITIEPDEKRKRRTLCEALDVALMCNQVRIDTGTWKVTLERLPKEKPTVKEKPKP